MQTFYASEALIPLTPTVAICVQLAIKHPMSDRVKLYVICNFWHPGTLTLKPVWYRTHMATAGAEGYVTPSCDVIVK